jgi:hypothetical protein
MTEECANCATPLVGVYCHACGQRRIERLTVRAFAEDVMRRVFRFDKAFLRTFWRMLYSPGSLTAGYLDGRRRGIVDPIQFFISSAFIQVVIALLTRAVVPIADRDSALSWLERIGSIVAVKILIIFWMATIWRLMFRAVRYNLAEIYAFSTYALGTIGLLWALIPLFDALTPGAWGTNTRAVALIAVSIEAIYLIYAVRQFARLPWWLSAVRVLTVLTVGYGLLVALVGLERAVVVMLPPMPAPPG